MSRRNGARKRRKAEERITAAPAGELPEAIEEGAAVELEEGVGLELDALAAGADCAEQGLPTEDAGEATSADDEPRRDPDEEALPDEEFGSGDPGEASAPSSRHDEDDEAPLANGEAPPLDSVIEAVLFASAEPVPLKRLVRLLSSWARSDIEAAVEELRTRLTREDRGIRLVEAAGGLQLRSSERFAPWVRRFFAERPPRLSRPVLETLAIIAYRQPVTRGEVEQVRGVNCDAVLGALTSRGLIRISGRRASPGRPAEYATTEAFLELFTLSDLGELPPLPDPAALANLVAEAPEAEGDAGDEASEEPRGELEGFRDAGDPGEEDARGDDGDHAEETEIDGEAAAPEHAASPEDSQPGGDRLAADGGGPDPERSGQGERPGGPGAGDAGGSDSGPHHG